VAMQEERISYFLIKKDDKNENPRFKGKFTSLDACVKFEKSKKDEISTYHYNMETSTKDTESNTINIFTIHNKY
jgi:hypothetical protein